MICDEELHIVRTFQSFIPSTQFPSSSFNHNHDLQFFFFFVHILEHVLALSLFPLVRTLKNTQYVVFPASRPTFMVVQYRRRGTFHHSQSLLLYRTYTPREKEKCPFFTSARQPRSLITISCPAASSNKAESGGVYMQLHEFFQLCDG
jgi:hypothetical protein